MSSKLLDGLQSKFSCLQCGKCCKYGGDMVILAFEVGNILEFISEDLNRDHPDMFEPVPFRPGLFKLVHKFPCCFFDETDNSCRVYEVRPEACKRYPFQSLSEGETTLAGVTICEGASKLVTKVFFSDEEA
jgi:uncharacterized protein